MNSLKHDILRSINCYPSASPTGTHIAHVYEGNLMIKQINLPPQLKEVRRFKYFTDTMGSKISQIEWEPIYDGKSKRIAILNQYMSEVRVYDYTKREIQFQISLDDIFHIEKLQWVQSCPDKPADHLMLFVKDKLFVKLVSLDGRFTEFPKPEINKLFKRKDGVMSLILKKQNFEKVVQYFSFSGASLVPIGYQTGLGPYTKLNKVCYSDDSKWIVTNETGKNGISIKLYPVVQHTSEPILEYVQGYDKFGAIDVQFLPIHETYGYNILFSDHFESVKMLNMNQGLRQIAEFKHRKDIPDSTVIYKFLPQSDSYVSKIGPLKLTEVSHDLPLHRRGILKFEVHGNLLYSFSAEFPNALFIWRLYPHYTATRISKLQNVILTANSIKDFQVMDDILIITNTNYITVYKSGLLPHAFYHKESMAMVKPITVSPLVLLVYDSLKISNHIYYMDTPFTKNHTIVHKLTTMETKDEDTSFKSFIGTSNSNFSQKTYDNSDHPAKRFKIPVIHNQNLQRLQEIKPNEIFDKSASEEDDTFGGRAQRRTLL